MGAPKAGARLAVSGAVPPKIYMNMGSRISDADEGSTPRWVWYMLIGLVALAVLGISTYLIATAPL